MPFSLKYMYGLYTSKGNNVLSKGSIYAITISKPQFHLSCCLIAIMENQNCLPLCDAYSFSIFLSLKGFSLTW